MLASIAAAMALVPEALAFAIVAVVMTVLVVQHGVEYLFAAVIGIGVIQLIIGWQKWGRLAISSPNSRRNL